MLEALQNLYANPTLRRLLKASRHLLAVALLVPLALWMNPDRLAIGLAISLLGQAIQTWCFAALVKNRELTVRGPYLLVRNPMYLGRYLLLLGFVWLLDDLRAIALYTLLYYPYMASRVRREEGRLERTFGDSYREYCRRVRRFLPSLRPLGDPNVAFFDWAMFYENNAHWNILGTAGAYVALLVLRHLSGLV